MRRWRNRYSFCRFWYGTRIHSIWHATFPQAHRKESIRKGAQPGDSPYV